MLTKYETFSQNALLDEFQTEHEKGISQPISDGLIRVYRHEHCWYATVPALGLVQDLSEVGSYRLPIRILWPPMRAEKRA